VKVSFNELDAMAKKAARGIGCPWGMAEEAGKAARWLCARGEDGGRLLAGHLTAAETCCCSDWDRAQRCPLRVGALLGDSLDVLAGDESLTFDEVGHPLLVAAFVVREEGCVVIAWEDATVVVSHEAMKAGGAALHADTGVNLRCTAQHDALPVEPWLSRAEVDETAWATLMTLAHRTYAPATDESRAKGAGANLDDND